MVEKCLNLKVKFALALLVLIAGKTAAEPGGATLPPASVLIKNIEEMSRIDYQNRGPGRVELFLGSHYLVGENSYQLYYCARQSARGGTYSSRDGGCKNDILVFQLNDGTWMMKFANNNSWRVISP